METCAAANTGNISLGESTMISIYKKKRPLFVITCDVLQLPRKISSILFRAPSPNIVVRKNNLNLSQFRLAPHRLPNPFQRSLRRRLVRVYTAYNARIHRITPRRDPLLPTQQPPIMTSIAGKVDVSAVCLSTE